MSLCIMANGHIGTPPPGAEWQTDTRENINFININFPQLRLRVVITYAKSYAELTESCWLQRHNETSGPESVSN